LSDSPPKEEKPPEKPAEKPVYYGVRMKPGTTELQANIALFAGWDSLIGKIRPTTRKSDHFWWLVEYFWGPTSPKPFHRNPWAEKQVEEYCSGKIVSVSGCASSGKTTTAALWALLSWACSPEGTKVIVTSTSIKGARNRIWGQIREFHSSAGYLDEKRKPVRLPIPGVVVDSIGVIRLDKKKDGRTASQMSTIELIAAEQSQEKEAVDKLIGIKNERVLFVLDEAPDLSPSVLSAAFGNLTSNPNFQLIALGNFKSINDTFGMLSTPVNGWNSVSVETQEWETVFQGQRGKCIRFDGTQSPNVIAGENLWKGLYSIEKYEKDKLMGENTIEYWRFCRSFVVPANVSDRVFSESDFIKGNSFGKARWKTSPIPVCSLDPAFTTGGDKSIGVLGHFGEDETGKWVLDIKEVKAFRENIMDSTTPFDFQIASQWRDWSKSHGVSPSDAAFDCTGSGISFGSIVSQIWSPQVHGVAFGGAASERPVSESDPTKCRDSYMNRCAEIWFQGKEFVRAGQIRGMTREISEDLVERKRSDKERGTKVGVEPKRDMKMRTGKSPDYGDSLLILLDLLRERRGFTAGRFGKALDERAEEDGKWQEQADEIYDENALLAQQV
jgi:hypothetical protein